MPLTLDTARLISACGKTSQICVDNFVFWGLLLMLGMALVKTAIELLKPQAEAADWRTTSGAGRDAPEGFRWVLVDDESIKD